MISNRSNWDSHWGAESQKQYWQKPADDIIRLRDSLDRQKIQEVLDLGCGIGRHAILFASTGKNTTGITTVSGSSVQAGIYWRTSKNSLKLLTNKF